jgi:DNA-binding NarL/FixJ family response regulator
MTALMRKLNVRNRTQVAVAAQALGWARIPGEADPRHA